MKDLQQFSHLLCQPSNHVCIPIDWYVWLALVVKRSEVAVWSSKPLIKAMLHWMKLRLMSQVPESVNDNN